MHVPLRARAARVAMSALLAVGALLPAAVPAVAQEETTLRVGTTQDLDSMNPFQTALVVGFEAFALNYELLVAFDQKLGPAPGYAESWTANSAGTEYTFKIPAGKKWSDGKPATAEDARWTFQLVLDALNSEAGSLCLGYIDPDVKNAAVESVSAPDAQTLVVKLSRKSDRILQTYVPILPKHIWESKDATTICDDKFDPPIVGSGPFQAQEWQTGQNVRFEANPNWTQSKLAPTEVILTFFETEDTMAQALRNNELDYAQGVLSDQFNQLKGQPNIATTAGEANGFTELGFNTYGTGTGKTIAGGGPSTKALLDPLFRDAVGYAIDKPLLVERVLGGYGVPGTTQVPPVQTRWHKEPATVREFNIDTAKQKLDAAGYRLDGQNRRLDKEGKPIVLDLVFPDSDSTYPTSAEFIKEWWGQLGIAINPSQYDSDTLIDLMLPPEAGDYKADYDLFIWGWGGSADPNALLEIFTCDQIGNSSDSLWCNEEYDRLFEEQNIAPTYEERKALMDQAQDLMYTEAPYHILYYDAALHAWRTDKFTGWANQPENGTPLFGYGPWGYLQLRLVGDEPTPGPSAPGAASPGASAPPGNGGQSTGSSNNTLLIVGGLGLLALVVVAGAVLVRRRSVRTEEE
ncbi:MAG TPA: ABC transporter substrate-binding protein [Candidatus Limnocylindrales bacterium]|jgi:peptide/nickel transport system substrate-binding protein